MVSKASEDLPEPETPVTAVSSLCGISKSMFLRLWTRAPRTKMLSVAMGNRSLSEGRRLQMRSSGAGNLLIINRSAASSAEGQQRVNVNPQHGHEVPVPGSDVHDKAAGFEAQ